MKKETKVPTIKFKNLRMKKINKEILIPVKTKRRLRVNSISEKENIQDICNKENQDTNHADMKYH